MGCGEQIIDWISKNVNILLTKISTGDKSVFSMEDEVRKVYSHNNNNDSTKPYAPINPAGNHYHFIVMFTS